jgi:hypothetical protein
MPQFALGGFGTILDLGQQRRLDPDGAVRDLFGVGLGFPDQRLEPGPQLLGGRAVEAVIDLPGIDQVVTAT